MQYCASIKKDDDGYMVTFPDIPNAFTHGDTLEDAKKYAAEALNGVLASDFERGFTIPKPKQYTGKYMYRIGVYPHIALSFALRALRKKQTQKDVAKHLGISYQAYQRLENPRTCNPTVKTLERIAEVLGKDMKITFS
ncbi:MAG: hypothetical protein UV82_C0002G0026 [Candidatus Magasanikbacteria bacterium GW2011_GWD2_43_18]|uniref:HTH cro/C1-type domain-containing protein n=1 Tax=Candidatus Magasanikbacteria bacterium GW2011_GWE2_42_7 TaxID=1619052 RepID=A0A0G1EDY6_9BACT|nr:MAG: hypothetical protein UV18_C0003G0026 [Candidatus Magasanikbacteria bacterium GW2011_GWC2_42_27]KKS72728.1 MAG: hypothetical protein UV42_C0005G0045 [Candidatus Magasanikbacteria bacterium GW2011_GWE2_42_7]KKT05056.1 MAG: hypothetical protein UV82_C0002G0026 [Candidatus Magasanikbacteria bacterium GW2011_GWD2_43_18]KKT24773.1 MAG: hypothetical protein UW10_C0020G0026 [Candidatus Magasanikbacteria bacterium GW2011_GWA2_43_9]HBB38328.1 type II toxin-antitoxin system HicB family antitoxin [